MAEIHWKAGAEVSRSRPLRVLVNDRVLLLRRTGVGHYVQQLLQALQSEAANGWRVRGFFSSWAPSLVAERSEPAGDSHTPPSHTPTSRTPPSHTPPSHARPSRSRPAWLRAGLQACYALAFRQRARWDDLVHEPNHIPIACVRPTVTTVHDLSVLVHPEWHPADRVRWYERAFSAGLRQTVRFIAASEFTRREMVRVLGLPPERIDVTWQAARPGFRPCSAEEQAAVLRRYGLPARYFLFVGTLEPRKNLLGLLAAYAGLPDGVRQRTPLAIAGGWGWHTGPLAERLRDFELTRDVRLLGYVQDDALAALYSACTALVWPSYYEGFGLPPLEALACGAPVIVSDAASLPEVVGPAGLLLPPHDTSAWSAAMLRMAEDADWRAAWAQQGPARAAQFSWAACARQTLATYERALLTIGSV